MFVGEILCRRNVPVVGEMSVGEIFVGEMSVCETSGRRIVCCRNVCRRNALEPMNHMLRNNTKFEFNPPNSSTEEQRVMNVSSAEDARVCSNYTQLSGHYHLLPHNGS